MAARTAPVDVTGIHPGAPVGKSKDRRASLVINQTHQLLTGLHEESDRSNALMAELEQLLAASQQASRLPQRRAADSGGGPSPDTTATEHFAAVEPLQDPGCSDTECGSAASESADDEPDYRRQVPRSPARPLRFSSENKRPSSVTTFDGSHLFAPSSPAAVSFLVTNNGGPAQSCGSPAAATGSSPFNSAGTPNRSTSFNRVRGNAISSGKSWTEGHKNSMRRTALTDASGGGGGGGPVSSSAVLFPNGGRGHAARRSSATDITETLGVGGNSNGNLVQVQVRRTSGLSYTSAPPVSVGQPSVSRRRSNASANESEDGSAEDNMNHYYYGAGSGFGSGAGAGPGPGSATGRLVSGGVGSIGAVIGTAFSANTASMGGATAALAAAAGSLLAASGGSASGKGFGFGGGGAERAARASSGSAAGSGGGSGRFMKLLKGIFHAHNESRPQLPRTTSTSGLSSGGGTGVGADGTTPLDSTRTQGALSSMTFTPPASHPTSPISPPPPAPVLSAFQSSALFQPQPPSQPQPQLRAHSRHSFSSPAQVVAPRGTAAGAVQPTPPPDAAQRMLGRAGAAPSVLSGAVPAVVVPAAAPPPSVVRAASLGGSLASSSVYGMPTSPTGAAAAAAAILSGGSSPAVISPAGSTVLSPMGPPAAPSTPLTDGRFGAGSRPGSRRSLQLTVPLRQL